MKKEAKKCIKYYLDNINSKEYIKLKKEKDIQENENHRKFIEEKYPQWKNRTDYYEDGCITNITICDVLSNDGVTKLLKKLHSLSRKRFKVRNYYKKSSLLNKYDYIHLQYTHFECGKFAEIKLIKDNYIDRVEISWVQINSYFALLEYKFIFKRCLDDELYSRFVYENIKYLNSKDYIDWYYIDKKREKNIDCLLLEQMQDKYFVLICQHYITTYLYTEHGKTNQLINMVHMTRKKPIDIDVLYLGDTGMAFHNQEENYVIFSEFDRINYTLIAGNNIIPQFSVSHYVFHYGNEFYYRFFGDRELKIFEREFSKFSTERKRIAYNKDLKRLLNKVQSVLEIENRKFNGFDLDFKGKWAFYIGNEKREIEDCHKKGIADYKKIYEDNFSYLRLLCEMNYTKSNHVNSLVATIVSIIATVISIIALLA